MNTGAARATIDWSHPWYEPWRHAGLQVQQHLRIGLPEWDALNRVGAAPVRFVAPDKPPSGACYEKFVADTGTCPTRNNLHDFFNGLCWIIFPATKGKLNQIHVAQMEALGGLQQRRGRVRDAVTLFDESGAFLQAPDVLWEALAAKQWDRLFWELRPLWSEARLVVFGHALLARLHTPWKALTAQVYRVPAAASSVHALDRWVARTLNADNLAAKPFVPLPVLGIPGWWLENSQPSFYEDAAVFRVAKAPGAITAGPVCIRPGRLDFRKLAPTI